MGPATPRRLLASLLLLVALGWAQGAAAACSCGFADGAYTLATETIDGTFTDWSTVLADTDNSACDAADGAGDPDSTSINNSGRDLRWFSQTWDNTYVYLYTEREGGNSAQQQFLYYADLDSDGFMETGEFVINAGWSNSGTTLTRYTYTQAVGGGDPMTNGSGAADGYTLQGTLGSSLAGGSGAMTGSSSATNGSTLLEFRIPWTALGVAAGTGVTFHVSTLSGSINSSNPPGNVNDNMSGCGGGLGGTKFASFTFTPDRSLSTVHNSGQPTFPYTKQVCGAHAIVNNGNDDDIFNIVAGTLPSGVTAAAYYSDVNNNGTYDSGTDTALTDSTDAGSVIDTGSVAVLATKNIMACYTVQFTNSYTPLGNLVVTTTASSAWNSSVNHSVTDTITVTAVADPVVTKSSVVVTDPINGAGAGRKRLPGSFIDYTVTIANQGGRAIDANTTIISDLINTTNASLFVNTLGGTPAGPVDQTNGATACGLVAASLTTLYSNNGAVTVTSADALYGYTPTADGNGVDSAVTAIRIKPSGTFAAQTTATPPSCSWRFRVRVK